MQIPHLTQDDLLKMNQAIDRINKIPPVLGVQAFSPASSIGKELAMAVMQLTIPISQEELEAAEFSSKPELMSLLMWYINILSVRASFATDRQLKISHETRSTTN